jgi:DNA/RNA endonuclease G (NUC1)
MPMDLCMRARFLLLLAHTALLAQPGRFGLPSCSAPGQELAVRSAFLLCHSSSLRVPLWTAHQLTRENLPTAFSRPRRFRRDTALAHPGAHDSDHRHSGYSRGPAVPAADVASSEQAVRDSFLLSNVVPQNSSLNSGKWRLLEKAIRRLAVDADFVVVFTGPIFCATVERIGANRVAVPCQLYKVILAAQEPSSPLSRRSCPTTATPRVAWTSSRPRWRRWSVEPGSTSSVRFPQGFSIRWSPRSRGIGTVVAGDAGT